MDVDTMKRLGSASLVMRIGGLKRGPGIWEGERDPLTYTLFREAVQYAMARGLRDEYIPDLRTENGILHAVHPGGRLIRLKYTIDWEKQEEYKALVEEMVRRMPHNL
jgi:hypothetical protein